MIKYGDLIIFDDKHKLLCGNSTKEEDIDYLLDDKEIMLYTDPPYNASFNGRSGDHNIIKNDALSHNDFILFTKKWYKNVCRKNIQVYYIWCNNYLKSIIENIDQDRWIIQNKTPIIWVKNNFGMGSNYRPKYEMLLFDGKIDNNILNECNVWEITKDNGETYIHPTQKPLECFERGIRNHTNINYILDIFAGSGSSLLATINQNKIWLGIELDNIYCDKIIRRYYDYTFSNNIKIIRDNKIIGFEEIKKELQLLKGSTKKGEITEQTRLF